MGSFSWTLASGSNNYGESSIYFGRPVKILIPAEFGGGYIAAKYCDYGLFFRSYEYSPKVPELVENEQWGPSFDVYEWLAVWNSESISNPFPAVSENTNDVRYEGISLDYSGKASKYYLKFVDFREDVDYEDVGDSHICPEQGVVESIPTKTAWKKFLKKKPQSSNGMFRLYDLKPGTELPSTFHWNKN